MFELIFNGACLAVLAAYVGFVLAGVIGMLYRFCVHYIQDTNGSDKKKCWLFRKIHTDFTTFLLITVLFGMVFAVLTRLCYAVGINTTLSNVGGGILFTISVGCVLLYLARAGTRLKSSLDQHINNKTAHK